MVKSVVIIDIFDNTTNNLERF